MSSQKLTVTYNSPTSTRTFSTPLPPLSNSDEEPTVQEKTAYLSALRSNIGQMQTDVNAFLTQKMEDEKAAESTKPNAKKSKEEREEEMYGEEDPENDA